MIQDTRLLVSPYPFPGLIPFLFQPAAFSNCHVSHHLLVKFNIFYLSLSNRTYFSPSPLTPFYCTLLLLLNKSLQKKEKVWCE
ncbi:hypothetical protein FKM82_021572 [Ascaphus truei]